MKEIKRVALLRIWHDDPNLEPVVVISDPDTDGMVQINRVIPASDDGATDRFHLSRFYKFDDQLMDRVNTLATRATDAKSAAINVLNAEGEFLFTEDDAMALALANLPESEFHRT
jgi:hypothetical protein